MKATITLSELTSLLRENERLHEIDRVFNEGWLPPLPAEPASLRLRSLNRLRELIPESSSGSRDRT